jgi:uncharacterized protein (TIGR04255 family)
MASFIQLKNTPIKEVIFTISFKENIALEKLELFKQLPQITEKFPIINTGFQTQLRSKNNEPPVSKVSEVGFIMKDKLNSYIIQAKKGSFAFHKVNGYESFETLLIKLETYWNELIKICGDLTILNLSVRYLNLIEKEKDEKISDLLNIVTKHPFGEENETNLTQHRFKYDKNSQITITVVTAKPNFVVTEKQNNKLKDGVVLDIIINKKINSDTQATFDFTNFNEMRTVKNEIFFKIITEKTINKYNK